MIEIDTGLKSMGWSLCKKAPQSSLVDFVSVKQPLQNHLCKLRRPNKRIRVMFTPLRGWWVFVLFKGADIYEILENGIKAINLPNKTMVTPLF